MAGSGPMGGHTEGSFGLPQRAGAHAEDMRGAIPAREVPDCVPCRGVQPRSSVAKRLDADGVQDHDRGEDSADGENAQANGRAMERSSYFGRGYVRSVPVLVLALLLLLLLLLLCMYLTH